MGRLDLPKRTAALAETVTKLEDHGLDITPDGDDKDIAEALVTS